MPTEHRSSNTEMVSALLPCPFCGEKPQITKHHREDIYSFMHRCQILGPISWGFREDQQAHIEKWNARAQPAPQPHPEPIAWMVGTAIWWTKEEAERDAAETGLPIVGLGPMTGAAPAEQQHGEPVAWLAKTLKGSLAGTLGLARYDQRLNPELYDGPFPVFRHADPGEVERLREGIARHWKVVCDQRAEIESLRDQLAKVVRSGALTAPEHEALEAECCALSATAEPSAPAAQA